MKTQDLAQKIISVLIESGLSIGEQLKVIKNVKERLDFCITTGMQMKQLTLEL
jgi:hypothetical protein